MASIEQLKASDGTGNANIATVQSTRSSGATTLVVDTVLGINPAGFSGSMGTPHTFTDPITSETITVISEATAVDFTGHVDGSNLEIDDIAPGYTDNGSEIGDIVIIRPTTQWSDDLAAILEASMNDDGSLKTSAVQAALNIPTTPTADWGTLATAPTTITPLGNRSYTILIPGVDYTDRLSAGMRLRTTRTVAAPTQCTSLNGSTQYYSKSSPSGASFTTTFTGSAWAKLSSYAAGGIIARRNADTEGWSIGVNSSGQITIGGYRIASNNKVGTSYQSLPLNKWVHVAASLDMTVGTTSGATWYMDGVSIPGSVTTTGTATALVQGTTALVVGAEKSAGTNPFPGKLAQVAVYSAVISSANILATISQGLSGSETSLISAYSFNNSISDLSATGNNLTAQGSAVATNADSPFGGQADGTISSTLDYAEIMSATFSTNTTLTVMVPAGNTIPTTGGVSALAYSTQDSPYGYVPLPNTAFGVMPGGMFGSTGNLTINGIGFKPKYIKFGLYYGINGVAAMSHGGMSDDGQFVSTSARIGGGGATENSYASQSNCLAVVFNSTTPATLASKVSIGNGTFTINIGTASSTYGFTWEAFR